MEQYRPFNKVSRCRRPVYTGDFVLMVNFRPKSLLKYDLLIRGLRLSIREPLYKNAILLMMTAAAANFLGYIFWIVVARFYSPADLGLATALISASGLLAVFSRLGFEYGLVRYLPEESDKKGMINTSFTIVGLFSLLLGMIFVAGLPVWSPAMQFMQRDLPLLGSFILFTSIYALSMLQGMAFTGLRAAKYSFFQSLALGLLRMPLPLVLAAFGALGIFFSWGLATGAALVLACFFLLPRTLSGYFPAITIKKTIVGEMMRFSAGNYVADMLDSLPGLLFPLLIVNILTREMSAYFFTAWTIAGILFTIPLGINASLLVEGSYEPQRLRRDVFRAIRFTYALLIPAVLIVFFLGDRILLLFGEEYSGNSLELLRILAVSSIPLAVVRTYVTVKRVRLNVRPVIAIYALIAVSTLFVSYWWMPRTGLSVIGVTWILAQAAVAAGVVWSMKRKRSWLTEGEHNASA